MRKLVAIILAVTLSMYLVVCGSIVNDFSNVALAVTNGTDETDDQKKNTTENKPETILTDEKISFESFTAIDNDECSVVVKEIDPDDMWGYTVKLKMENKSTDKTYMFSVASASINGVDTDPFFAEEIAPGKKANADMTFTLSDLEENGITVFTDIEVVFTVYDSDDWIADPVAEEIFHIYPYGKKNATEFVRESQESDVVLAENDYISVVLTGQEEDSIWGYTLKLFIENKSDKELMFSVDDASVNGYMADPFFAKSLLPSKCAFTTISWDDAILEENDIDEIESIEFQMSVYDENDWSAPEIFNDVIIVTN